MPHLVALSAKAPFMFVDQVTLLFSAGKGGNGAIAWARRKYEPKGGPSGGNGGDGGSIILRADSQINSLEKLADIKECKATPGSPGKKERSTGPTGDDLIIAVPQGIVAKDQETGEIIADLVEDRQEVMICSGGRGGRGNATFKSSTRRAPYLSTEGLEGQRRQVHLELKSIADIGLVGMPNAGKSSLLTALTKAKAEIGAYPFTTKLPNLGTLDLADFQKLIIADIPGIGIDAHKNRGLGLTFLRHIERTKALVFVLDAGGSEGRTPLEDYRVLVQELRHYRAQLLDLPSLIALNKIDLPQAEDFVREFCSQVHSLGEIVEISTLKGLGLEKLTHLLANISIK